MKGKYRPAEEFSDEEDEYEGLSFAPEPRVRDHTHAMVQFQQMQAKILVSENIAKAIQSGNLDALQTLLHTGSTFGVHDVLSQGWTPLMYACKSGKLKIVEYLVQRNVDVNMAVEAQTPLMLACQCSEDRPHDVLMIVKCLIKHGAVLNICDQYGVTPLMLACASGHLEVVNFLLPLAAKDALEAVDNMGCTAIFHAIENNRLQVVELLLKRGALTNIYNKKGYKPKQVAEFYGFQDIVDLFPEEIIEYMVPENWMTYSTFYDLLPGLSGKTNEMPAYFPDLGALLYGMRMEQFATNLAKVELNLKQLLTIDDGTLQDLGLTLPLERKRIHLGLLKFHCHTWSKKCLAKLPTNRNTDLFDFFCYFASHLKQIVVMLSSIEYISHNQLFESESVPPELVDKGAQQVRLFRQKLLDLRKKIVAIKNLNPPKPVLLLSGEPDKRSKWTKIKVASFFGLLFTICFRKRILQCVPLLNWPQSR